jgi:hypothetical protein
MDRMGGPQMLEQYISLSSVKEVGESLGKSEAIDEAKLGIYFLHYEPPEYKERNIAEGVWSPPPIQILGEIVSRATKGIGSTLTAETPSKVVRAAGAAFIAELFAQIRTIICGNTKKATPLGEKSQAAISALAAIVAHKLGVADSAATAIAVLVFLSIGRAAKTAFCKITRPEELERLLNQLH